MVINVKKGRPKIQISRDMLEYYVDSQFTLTQMASILRVSKSTVQRRLWEMNISISCRYSLINDEDINKHVKKKIMTFIWQT